MNKLTKIIAVALAAILGLSVIGFGGWWVWNNKDALLSNSKMYTEEDVTGSYDDGYNAGLGSYYELLEQIEELEAFRAAQTLEIERLRGNIDSITMMLLGTSNLTAEQKAQLQSDLDAGILDISEYVEQLDALITSLKIDNTIYRNQIAQLEEDKTNLQITVDAYEDLENSLDLLETEFAISFKSGDSVVPGVVWVPFGQGLTEDQTPIEHLNLNQYSTFIGWSLSDEVGAELIDWDTWIPTGNTIVYAQIEYYYSVNFVYDNKAYAERIALKGSTIPTVAYDTEIDPTDLVTVENPQSTDKKIFLGWSTNGTTIVDTANNPINETTTYFAVIDYKYTIIWKIRNETYEELISVNTPVAPMTAPKITGYAFRNWELNGKVANFDNLMPYDFMTFIGHYNGLQQSYSSEFNNLGSNITSYNPPGDYAVNFLYIDIRVDFQTNKYGWQIRELRLDPLNNWRAEIAFVDDDTWWWFIDTGDVIGHLNAWATFKNGEVTIECSVNDVLATNRLLLHTVVYRYISF